MITEKRILQTIEAMHERGEKLTQASIREALGGGSFSTINTALRAFRDNQAHQETAPDAFVEKLTGMADALFTVALDEAERRFANTRAELIKLREEQQEEINARNDEILRLEAIVDEGKATLETRDKQLADANDRERALMETIKALEENLASASKLATEEATRAKTLENVVAALSRQKAE